MELAARTGAWTPSGAPLPYLRRVAYLESHGTEWIDTGVKYETPNNVHLKCSSVLSGSEVQVFGARNSAYSKACVVFLGAPGVNCIWYVQNGGTTEDATRFRVDYDIPWTIDINPSARTKTYTYNGNTVSFTDQAVVNAFVGDYTLYLFNANGNPTSKNPFIGKIYEARVENQFNLIPVLDLSGRPCMYDDVSGQLFYNQGAGEFTWGELDAASNAPSQLGGGYNRQCVRRSHRRSLRPSARFCARSTSQRWEVAA